MKGAPVAWFQEQQWIVYPSIRDDGQIDCGWVFLVGGKYVPNENNMRLIPTAVLIRTLDRPPSQAVWDVLRVAL